jgi:hypothetical protein
MAESPVYYVHEYEFLLLSGTLLDTFLVLNPKEKMGYFKKHWSVDLQEDVMKCIEEVVWASSPSLDFQR